MKLQPFLLDLTLLFAMVLWFASARFSLFVLEYLPLAARYPLFPLPILNILQHLPTNTLMI